MQQREMIQTKKYGSAIFRSQRNLYIKFQNLKLNFFERTNKPTHTDKPKQTNPHTRISLNKRTHTHG